MKKRISISIALAVLLSVILTTIASANFAWDQHVAHAETMQPLDGVGDSPLVP